jgi:alpha-1,2-mannosyltransferase
MKQRAIAYAWMAAIALGVAADAFYVTAQGLFDVGSRPAVSDFLNVWAAGRMALDGHAADAYDWSLHAAVERTLFNGVPVDYFGWHYPPLFFLVAAPLALLGIGWARLVWLAATLAGYVACMRAIVPRRGATLGALAFTGVAVNLGAGQNGFFSAALLAGGMLLLERRPAVAGCLFGALAYKPQLALLLPFALLAGRHWRALLAAALTVAVLAAVTVALFGVDTWIAFKASLALTQQRVLEQGGAGFQKMVSVFAAVRAHGGSVGAAWLAQGAASLAGVAVVVWAWRRPGPVLLKGALLGALIPVTTPYAFPYDLMVLALPAAYLLREGLRAGFAAWEHPVLIAAFVLPWTCTVGAVQALALPLAPPVAAALAAALARRLVAGSSPPLPGAVSTIGVFS